MVFLKNDILPFSCLNVAPLISDKLEMQIWKARHTAKIGPLQLCPIVNSQPCSTVNQLLLGEGRRKGAFQMRLYLQQIVL